MKSSLVQSLEVVKTEQVEYLARSLWDFVCFHYRYFQLGCQLALAGLHDSFPRFPELAVCVVPFPFDFFKTCCSFPFCSVFMSTQ